MRFPIGHCSLFPLLKEWEPNKSQEWLGTCLLAGLGLQIGVFYNCYGWCSLQHLGKRYSRRHGCCPYYKELAFFDDIIQHDQLDQKLCINPNSNGQCPPSANRHQGTWPCKIVLAIWNWYLVDQWPTVLLVSVNSQPYLVLLSCNVRFSLPFVNLVTTTWWLKGKHPTEETFCFTINFSTIGSCIQLYHETMGNFHGKLTYGIMLGMKLHVSSYWLQMPKVSPSILHPPHCARLPQMPTFCGTSYLLGTLPSSTRCNIYQGLPDTVI